MKENEGMASAGPKIMELHAVNDLVLRSYAWVGCGIHETPTVYLVSPG
jgi:hypothetical protein